ncbi:hypothetical protein C5D35_01250 [Rathayibacter toxicus]|nr:hypothetical protein C5D35_01250 [Rathayibacter toxicus]
MGRRVRPSGTTRDVLREHRANALVTAFRDAYGQTRSSDTAGSLLGLVAGILLSVALVSVRYS